MELNLGLSPQWVKPLPDDTARFRIRPLTGAARLELTQELWRRGSSLSIPASAQYEAVKAAVVDWDGVYDKASGDPVTFDPERLELVPDEVLVILFGKVYELSTLGTADVPEEDEAGNSESQSR